MSGERDQSRDAQAAPSEAGVAAPLTPFESGHTRAVWTVGLLAVVAAMEFVVAGVNVRINRAALAGRGDHLDAGGTKNWVIDLVVVCSIVAFSFWTHRVYRNLPALRARDLRHTPGWAVAWLFIPLANLVIPYFVFVEIWKNSIPALAGKLGNRRPLLLIGWWIANILPFVVLIAGAAAPLYGYLKLVLSAPSLDPGQIARSINDLETKLFLLTVIVLPLMSSAAAVLAIFVVRRIDKNQQTKYEVICGAQNQT